MHKGWFVILFFYLLITAIGTVVFKYKDTEPIEPAINQAEDTTVWKPTPLTGNAIGIVTLDDSSKALAKHIEPGHQVRLCVRPEENRPRPPAGWCGPVLTVAGLPDDLDDSPWLAVYVPTSNKTVKAAAYIVTEKPVLLYVGPGNGTIGTGKEEVGVGPPRIGSDEDDDTPGNDVQTGDPTNGRDPPGKTDKVIVVQTVDGHFDIFGTFMQILQHASISGIDLTAGTAKSLRDFALEAAGEFTNAFAKTVGEETAKQLFGPVPLDERPIDDTIQTEDPNNSSERPLIATANIYFNVDEASVPNVANAIALLADINDLAKEHTACTATVFGHADRSGPKAYNRRLSKNRARSVAALLDKFPANSLTLRACGENIFRLPTDDDVLERQNRRVELVASCEDENGSAGPVSSDFGHRKDSLCEEIKD